MAQLEEPDVYETHWQRVDGVFKCTGFFDNRENINRIVLIAAYKFGGHFGASREGSNNRNILANKVTSALTLCQGHGGHEK